MPDLNKGQTALIRQTAADFGCTPAQTAYLLATAFWETAGTMEPVEEAYYLGARAEAYRKSLRYAPWWGRGFVQLTWLRNYLLAGQKLDLDLTTDPDRVMEPAISAQILVRGSMEGWFTGKPLTAYVNAAKTDFVNARRVINGTDKAAEIAKLAGDYLAALPAVMPAPISSAGFMAALASLLSKLFKRA